METEEHHSKGKGWQTFFGWVFGIFCVLWFIAYFIDLSSFRGEIIAYPAQCSGKVEYNICKGKPEYTLRRSFYKPLVERQEVLHWVDEFEVDRLTKCAVKNRENWKCDYNDKSATFGFNNGQYFYYSNVPSKAEGIFREYFISKKEYMKIGCGGGIFGTLVCPFFYM